MSVDTHAYVLSSGERLVGQRIDGRGYSEALKASNQKNIAVGSCNIYAGTEDCIDLVRGSNYTISRTDLYSFSRQRCRTFITAKGGIKGLTLSYVTFNGDCVWPWQISLGDHTIYNDRDPELPLTRGVTISNCRRADGKPLRVLVVAAERPTILNCEVKLIVIPWWIWKPWFTLKRLFSRARRLLENK